MAATHFTVPHNLRVGEYTTIALGSILSTLIVAARMYTKIRLTKSLKWEDYLSVLAWAGFMTYVGLGADSANINSTKQVIHATYLSQIISLLYSPVIVFIKSSILLQYQTLFVPSWRGTVFWIIQSCIWTNVVFYFICMIIEIFQCNPRQKLWNPAIPGHCINKHHQIFIATGAFNVVSDFSIFIIPIPLIWRLKAATKKKLGVLAVFSVGLFTCITSIVRLVYSVEVIHLTPSSLPYLFTTLKIGIWSYAELALGIIIGCLPVLPRFYQHVFKKRDVPPSKGGLIANSGSGSRLFWRQLFSTNHSSSHGSGRKILHGMRLSSKKSDKKAPYDMTGNSSGTWLPLEEPDLLKVPPPVAGGINSTRTTVASGNEPFRSEKHRDLESGHVPQGITRTIDIESHMDPNAEPHAKTVL